LLGHRSSATAKSQFAAEFLNLINAPNTVSAGDQGRLELVALEGRIRWLVVRSNKDFT
jgi:hypothetical protein